ncbi:MAG: undecaprenyl-diphosphate phosphatase [Thaumarchaeota archaeon]|nr:undecaprenyl-diphosphate phosphatase [Nitrososphaerota archaeon]
MVNILYSVIVGIVQGVAEWLPISSKTQVLLVSNALFALPLAVAYAFGLFMEIGSVGSALIYFRKDVFSLFKNRKLLMYLLVVTIVTALIGAPIYLMVERTLQGSYNVGIPMLILGAVLISNGFYIRRSRTNPKIVNLENMTLKHYVIVGIAQGIAALPGVSRSGMTTSTMLLMGVKPDVAFRLSFLAYIPAAIGAFMITVLFSKTEVKSAVATIDSTGIMIAIASSVIIGLLVISSLLKIAKSNKIYLINFILGAIALTIGTITTIKFG